MSENEDWDLRVDTFRTGDEVRVKVTHLPTGEVMNTVGGLNRYQSEADIRDSAIKRLRDHIGSLR